MRVLGKRVRNRGPRTAAGRPLVSRGVALALAAGLLAALSLASATAHAPGAPSADGRAADAPASLRGTKPNIVLVLTDDQTVESASKMPYLQSGVRQGRYIEFPNAEVNNSICCPSRASILTGQVDTRTGVINNTTGREQIKRSATVAVALDRAGYRTALIGKLLNGYKPSWGGFPGWDVFEPLVKGVYRQYDYTLLQDGREVAYGSEPRDYGVDVLTERADQFIRDTERDEPLFLYLAPTSGHVPWTAAPRHVDRHAHTPIPPIPSLNEADVSDKPEWIRSLPPVNMNEQNRIRRKQWDAALGVDDLLRKVDRALADTGRSENTVVLFVSDNGLAMGEHRWFSKRCELRVCSEMLTYVRYPGVRGRVDPRLVTNLDFAPTFAALAGTEMSIQQDGVNLVPLLEDREAVRSSILLHWPGGSPDSVSSDMDTVTPGFYGVRTQRWRYVELETGERELYDQTEDPYELDNLLGPDSRVPRAHTETVAELRAELARLKKASRS